MDAGLQAVAELASAELVKVVHFVRHAQSVYNAAQHSPEPHDPMVHDAPLTEHGQAQATAAANADLAAIAPPPLIIVSPLSRAIQTALLVFPDAPIVATRPAHPNWAHTRVVLNDLGREAVSGSDDIGSPPHLLAAAFPGLDTSSLPGPVWWYTGPDADDGDDWEASRERYLAAPYDEPDAVFASRMDAWLAWMMDQPEPVAASVSHYHVIFHLTGYSLGNAQLRSTLALARAGMACPLRLVVRLTEADDIFGGKAVAWAHVRGELFLATGPYPCAALDGLLDALEAADPPAAALITSAERETLILRLEPEPSYSESDSDE
ncbi:phosphoglycerate mutase [Thecamonas trahens ATCC 50062]|uniref:Phosphoglycerate mutase n=1 Tax=Thecamonas trahens ATCC 50062 TaxID=461836 RepID=A0A0L0DQB4_THETB|nr:phosphoglycerate mutase [Thecamonas trahens ATCC 50062]KNC54216.1 phosphoglycerate mutase [Thecamonas trahens ATCC 50062]|eukprot:XP_013753855.1 phosphoglycerate mutase [Thecamonas trahens ATCC 50062]